MTRLHISPDLYLPLEAVTQTFGILAIRGAGKSNTAAVMAEEMFAAQLPFVVIDPHGTWWGLRSTGSGGPGLPIPIFGGKRGDVPLEKTGGHLLADLVVDQRLSCVLDISDLTEGDKIRFLAEFADRLYRRNEQPLHLFLEEADDYIPQKPGHNQLPVLGAFENLVRRGRARGLGVTLITQRSAVLNKNVLTQIETLIVMRTTSPQDRKAISAWVDYHGQSKELLDSLPSLENGEAWIWSPHWLKTLKRVRIRLRSTYDSAATPKTLKKKPAATLADIDLGAIRTRMADTIERAKEADPREWRKRNAEQAKEIARLKKQIESGGGKTETVPERVVEVPVFQDDEVERLEGLFLDASVMTSNLRDISNALDQVKIDITAALNRRSFVDTKIPTGPSPFVTPPRPRVQQPKREATVKNNGDLTGPAQRILNALAELQVLGVGRPERVQVAFLAGYSNLSSKGFVNAIGSLSTGGLVVYPEPGKIAITDAGGEFAVFPERPRSVEDVQERVISLLGGASERLLRPLIESYPNAIEREVLAEKAGYTNLSSKGFVNAIGRLRSLGFIDYPSRGWVVAQRVLFLEGG